MHIRDLNEVHEQLQQQGVALHLITAETGGAEVVEARLAERDTISRFPVHSDPEHTLLLPLSSAASGSEDAHSLFVKRRIDASQYGGTYEDYMMVQPAFVVVDRQGSIQQVWSWRTEPLDTVEPKEEMTLVASYGGAALVSVRPDASDIGLSIKEERQVTLQGKGMLAIMREMPKSTSMAEFNGSLLRVMKSVAAVVRG